MPWSAPLLGSFITICRRSVADEDANVFSTDLMADFILEAIGELNQWKPVETVETLSQTFVMEMDYVFAVEMVSDSLHTQFYIPPNDPQAGGRNGWEYFNKTLYFGAVWQARIEDMLAADSGSVRVWGYTPRDIPDDSNDYLDFVDFEDEFASRRFVRLASLRMLNTDRALFQQWQQQANNSDVSPTQLQGMLGMAEQDWDRLRKRIAVQRRPPIGL